MGLIKGPPSPLFDTFKVGHQATGSVSQPKTKPSLYGSRPDG
jgi:hypothetical protein